MDNLRDRWRRGDSSILLLAFLGHEEARAAIPDWFKPRHRPNGISRKVWHRGRLYGRAEWWECALALGVDPWFGLWCFFGDNDYGRMVAKHMPPPVGVMTRLSLAWSCLHHGFKRAFCREISLVTIGHGVQQALLRQAVLTHG